MPTRRPQVLLPWLVFSLLAPLVAACHVMPCQGADWGQWRGPERSGVAVESPPLIDALPADGLRPQWIVRDKNLTPRNGGWSSPVVAGERVYLYSHLKERVGEGEPPPRKFPYLPPEQRTGMSDAQYAEYERNRRDEEEAHAKFFRFEEQVVCLAAGDGRELWRRAWPSVYTRFSQSGSPAVVDGRLFVLGAGRVARCLSIESGEILWERQLPGEFRDEYLQSSFLVVGQLAIVLCDHLFALDVASGEIRWTAGEDAGTHCSPVAWRTGDKTRIVVNVGKGQTACFDPADGRELWRVRSDASHSTPVVVGDLLLTYGGSRRGGLRCYRLAEDGATELWTYHELADDGSSPVVLDGHVFLQGERKLACVELATGKAAWLANLDLGRPRYTSLVAADGKVYYAFERVLCFAAAPDSYRPLSQGRIDKSGTLSEEESARRALGLPELEKTSEGEKEARKIWDDHYRGQGPLACATPAIADGRLLVRLEDGLVCYDLRRAADAAR